MSSRADAAVEVSGTLGGYRLLSRVAVGGMAEVWRATGQGPDGEQPVAVKTMLPGAAKAPEMVRMFLDEAAVLARLRHPNVARFIDCGSPGGRHYLAMEYIDGITLREAVRRFRRKGRRIPVPLLVELIRQACVALHHAHELREGDRLLGFVHRDVSPENLMITRAGQLKLIDFGAAHLTSVGAKTGPLFGKFRYIAPERIEGQAEDRRADVYALGVILYECLTGVLPFDGDDLAIVSRILAGGARDPREIEPELPRELADITMAALAPDRELRYSTAEGLGRALELYQKRRYDQQPLGPPPPLLRPEAESGAQSLPQPRERFAPDAHHANDDITRPVPVVENLFDRRRERPSAPLAHAWKRDEAPDIFAVRRGGSPVASLPAARPERRRAVNIEAARAFDSGLRLLDDGHYERALIHWERALELDPENRMYVTNLKRLRARVSAPAERNPRA